MKFFRLFEGIEAIDKQEFLLSALTAQRSSEQRSFSRPIGAGEGHKVFSLERLWKCDLVLFLLPNILVTPQKGDDLVHNFFSGCLTVTGMPCFNPQSGLSGVSADSVDEISSQFCRLNCFWSKFRDRGNKADFASVAFPFCIGENFRIHARINDA